ncbi:MAG: glutamine--fructose-6-phosphate transaminase (isomerizing) [archaeon]|nr:glutamine--fructose-6-phosphate transaminase (isomerizing) [archaeon]
MCSIFAYIGYRKAQPILLDGIRRMEYRGYDSAGIAVKNPEIQVIKSVGNVSQLQEKITQIFDGQTGIAHTRWATHGGVTDENAHPHFSFDRKVVLVHNGIIENYKALARQLQSLNIELKSQTDTEIIAHLIALELKSGKNPTASVLNTVKKLRGTWGICVMFADHQELVCARFGSPLLVGKNENEMFVSSDPHALHPYTDRVIFLEEGHIATLTQNNVELSSPTKNSVKAEIVTLEQDWGEAELGEFEHFMLKEIYEQPDALRHCVSGRMSLNQGIGRLGGMRLEPAVLQQTPHVRLLGCGTAFHAAEIGAALVERLARIPAVATISSEFKTNDPVINPKAIHLAISQSGETADTIAAIQEIHLKGAKAYGVVNVVGSTISRLCGQGVYIHSGPEQAVASTKAFTNMIAALTLFATQIGRSRHISKDQGVDILKELQQIPHKMEGYLESQGDIMKAVELLKDAKCVLFLGRGISAPVAKEGALKLMEVAYIPCLAYPAGEIKHGPIALLEEGSPVVVVAPNDSLQVKALSAIHECRARGAKIILIHEEGDSISSEGDISIAIPKCHELLSPLLTVIPLQLIAYHTAVARGCNVDRPRNLAKSVTVE